MKFQSIKPDYVVRVDGVKCTFQHGIFETTDKKIIASMKKNKNIKEIGKVKDTLLDNEE